MKNKNSKKNSNNIESEKNNTINFDNNPEIKSLIVDLKACIDILRITNTNMMTKDN